MNKKELRRELKETISNIVNKAEKSKIIVSKLESLLSIYKVIALYMPLEDEVNIEPLISILVKDNKKVVIPKINGDAIDFFEISLGDLFTISSNRYGIKEPINGRMVPSDEIDVIVCPGLGFDKELNRIGRGKGYYDRYLTSFNGKKIGVCYKEQIVDKLPISINDIKMDIIISD